MCAWMHRLGVSVAYLRYNHEDVRLDAAGTACKDATGWTAGGAAERGPEGQRCLERGSEGRWGIWERPNLQRAARACSGGFVVARKFAL